MHDKIFGMTLTTHALVGATAATLFPEQPVVACAAAFASHLAIDALPHWDYKILSKQEGETKLQNDIDTKSPLFRFDLMRIGSDALWGTMLSLLIFSIFLNFPWWLVVLGAWAGILPDALQFVYFKTRSQLLLPLQRFHIWIQKGKSMYPPPLVGMFYQVVLVVVVITARLLLF